MIIMGRYSYCAAPITQHYDDADIIIGNYCSIADKVQMFTGGNHRVDWVSTYPFGKHRTTKGNIVIGNDVWIGYGVTIMSGVNIGDGAIIGAMSVVASDVCPYTVVVGNPAKFQKFRFKWEQVEQLIKIKWWDWEPSKVIEWASLLQSDNVDEFIRRATE